MSEPKYVEEKKVPGVGMGVSEELLTVVRMVQSKRDTWLEVPKEYLDPRALYKYAQGSHFEGYVTMRGLHQLNAGDTDTYFVKWVPHRRRVATIRDRAHIPLPQVLKGNEDG